MSDQPTIVLLKAQVDQSEAALGVKALQQIQAATDGARKSLLAINDDAAKVSSVFQRLEDVSKIIGRDTAINDLAAQFVELGKQTGDYETQLLSLRDALREVGASSEEIDKATVAFATLADEAKQAAEEEDSAGLSFKGVEGLRRTGSALRGIGLESIGEPVSKAGDIAQVIKEFQQLGNVVEKLPEMIAATTVSIGGMELALGPLLLALAPVAAAIGSVVLILKLLSDQAQDAANKVKRQYDESRQYWDAQDRAKQEALTTTPQQVDQKAQDLGRQIADANTRLGFLIANGQSQIENAPIGSQAAATKQVQQNIEDYIKHINDLQKEFDYQTKLLGPLAKAHADYEKQLEAEKKAQDERNASAEQGIEHAKQDAQLLASGTSAGVSDRIQQIQAEMQAINDAIGKGGLDQAEIEKLAQRYHDLDTEQRDLIDHIQPLVDARESEKKAIDATQKAIDSLQGKYDSTSKEAANLADQMAQQVRERGQQVARELADEKRQEERAGVEKEYTARIAEAKREEAKQKVRDDATRADEKAVEKHNEAMGQATTSFFDAVQKIWQSYYDTEKQATDRYNLDRLHTIEKAQMDLKQLAAAGDVAGFVNRSNQAKDELKNQKDNQDLAEEQRQQSLNRQLEAAQENYTKQIDALNASFDQEKAARDAAAEQRIADIEAQGAEANSKSAQLEQELNDIREQWRKDDLQRQRDQEEQAWNDRLQMEGQKLAELQKQVEDFYNQIAASLTSMLNQRQVNEYAGALSDPSSVFSSHATGGDLTEGWNRLGEEGPEWVWKEGNRATVRSASQSSSLPGDTYQIDNITVQVTAGNVASVDYVDNVQAATVDGIHQSFQQAKGRGN